MFGSLCGDQFKAVPIFTSDKSQVSHVLLYFISILKKGTQILSLQTQGDLILIVVSHIAVLVKCF